jgi:hypothetical protein
MPINDQHGVYTSKSFVLEFLWALSKHFKSILHEYASTSHVYSILVDESIDPSMKQHLIFGSFLLFGFSRGTIKWHLFWRSWLSRMPHEKICLLSFFLLEKLGWDLSKLVALATNWATFMIGCNQRLSTQL